MLTTNTSMHFSGKRLDAAKAVFQRKKEEPGFQSTNMLTPSTESLMKSANSNSPFFSEEDIFAQRDKLEARSPKSDKDTNSLNLIKSVIENMNPFKD